LFIQRQSLHVRAANCHGHESRSDIYGHRARFSCHNQIDTAAACGELMRSISKS
jgi:hypothetical protein